jgi:hypothetical protein
MQGCVQNGGTKIIQTKHVYSHKIVSLPHYQVLKEGMKDKRKRKEREKEAVMYNQSPLIKNIMCG